jgi:hypothetical protein
MFTSSKSILGKSLRVLAIILVAAVSVIMLPVAFEKTSAATVGPRANTAADPANGIYVSPTGNDVTANGTIALPYKSINTALEWIRDNSPLGATVILCGGTYQEKTKCSH